MYIDEKTNIIHRERKKKKKKKNNVSPEKKNLFVFSFIYLLKNQE
jgi:hypothetical protein